MRKIFSANQASILATLHSFRGIYFNLMSNVQTKKPCCNPKCGVCACVCVWGLDSLDCSCNMNSWQTAYHCGLKHAFHAGFFSLLFFHINTQILGTPPKNIGDACSKSLEIPHVTAEHVDKLNMTTWLVVLIMSTVVWKLKPTPVYTKPVNILSRGIARKVLWLQGQM